ncbi:MAG: hypothetical protein IRY94_20885, partial [Rhodospirillaceae bacterium]|nr:hypothetical protein [Rhodospirillaceae bacterium]
MAMAHAREDAGGGAGLGARFLAVLGLCAFLWTMTEAIAVQTVVAPRLFPESGATGLVSPDSRHYQPASLALAHRIETEGWGAWSLRPDDAAPVGLAAALYAALWPDLRLVTGVSAAFHVAAFLVLTAIVHRVTGAGRLSALAALPFLLLPSSIVWVSGLAKDGPYLLGLYLTFLAFLVAAYGPPGPWAARALWAVPAGAAGIGLAWWMRPYAVDLFATALAAAALAAAAGRLRPLRGPRTGPAVLAAVLAVAALAAPIGPVGARIAGPTAPLPEAAPMARAYAAVNKCWSSTPWLPAVVERRIRLVAYNRALLHFEAPAARTTFDRQLVPCSAREVLLTLPRSLLQALLGPLPTQWAAAGGSPILAAAIGAEMAVIYLGLGALVALGHRARRGG